MVLAHGSSRNPSRPPLYATPQTHRNPIWDTHRLQNQAEFRWRSTALTSQHLGAFYDALAVTEVVLRNNLYDALDELHTLRNRVAHHEPIHQRNLNADMMSIYRLLDWIEADVRAWALTFLPRPRRPEREAPPRSGDIAMAPGGFKINRQAVALCRRSVSVTVSEARGT